MKPAILLSLIFSLCLFLTGCGSGGSGEASNHGSSPQSTITPTSEQPITATQVPSVEPSLVSTIVPTTQTWRLDWSIPETRADGSPMAQSDISGYVIKWTNTSSQETGEEEVAAGVTQHQLTLPTGTYQFEIATKDIYGRQSHFTSPQG